MLALCFVCLVALFYSSAHGDSDSSVLREFLQPGADCALPCWQGIRPGVTGSLEAIEILKTIPWVKDIYSIQGIVINDSFVRWGWNGQQPDGVDSARDGQMWFHNGLVYAIDIPLTVSFDAIWSAFGAPETVSALIAPLRPPQVFYRASYFHQTVEIHGNVACPLNAYNLLDSRMDVHIVVVSDTPYPPVNRRLLCRSTHP